MYEETADSYAEMMDSEIDLPVYADILGRLSRRLEGIEGDLIDTACGSGHMLAMYRDRYDGKRPLLGVDLAPRMVAITGKRLGDHGRTVVADMCRLGEVADGSAAAVLNFFALHHLDSAGVVDALREWHRVLRPEGQLVVATWEGEGPIDYGDASDLFALRYRGDELKAWARDAGFEITRCAVEPVEDFPMNVVYLEATKP